MEALTIVVLVLAVLISIIGISLAIQEESIGPKPKKRKITLPPKFIIELEGPFLTREEVVYTVGLYHSYDDWAILIDGEMVRPFRPDVESDNRMILIYEKIGDKIYRK